MSTQSPAGTTGSQARNLVPRRPGAPGGPRRRR